MVGVLVGRRVLVGPGVCVTVRVGVMVGVNVGVVVGTGVLVGDGVTVGTGVLVMVCVAVGLRASPVMVNLPEVFQVVPTKMRTSYSPGCQSADDGLQPVYSYPPVPPSQAVTVEQMIF